MSKYTTEQKIQAVIEYIDFIEDGLYSSDAFKEMRDVVMDGYIKPCPFCGSPDHHGVYTSVEIHGENEDLTGDAFAVCCDFTVGGCGATGCFKDNRKDAIEQWNTRA